MDEYLTESDLAKKLQMSRTVLYQLRKEGMPYRRIHRTIRYNPEEVEAWLAQHGHGIADTTSHNKKGD